MMHGRVTWVGSSSMEVYVGIYDKADPSHDILVCNRWYMSSEQCIARIRTYYLILANNHRIS